MAAPQSSRVVLILLALGAGAMGLFQMRSKSLKAKLEERPLPSASEKLPSGLSETLPLAPRSINESTTELLELGREVDTN